jgi:DNA-binding transcriptional ArsR family regulator
MESNSCIRLKADINQIKKCQSTIEDNSDTLDYLSNTLSLAGNNVRLKILLLLHQEKKLCVCDLSDILNMKISAISQHLRKLKDRNIIYAERDAQTIFYSITNESYSLLEPFFNILTKNELILTK